MAAAQSAMSGAWRPGWRAERLPRAAMAAILALVPAIVLLRLRGRTVAWLLAVAAFSGALFHLGYAVLAGRTCSPVGTSSGDLITFVAASALLAFFLGSLVFGFGLRIWRGAPGRAARLTAALALTTAYLIVLPILWSYVINGLFVTWALPDFGSLFLALISGIQVLAVAVGG